MNKYRLKPILLLILLMLVSIFSAFSQADTTKTKKTSFAVYPALGSSPETGFMYGIIAFMVLKDKDGEANEFYRPTSISPYFLYTQKKQVLSALDIDVYLKNGLNINTIIRYFNFPDFFYGIGNQTDPDHRELYTDRFYRVSGRVMKPVNQNLFVGLLYDLQYNDIRKVIVGGDLENSNAIGIDGGRNMGIGPGLLYDSRNSTLYPTDGTFLNAGITLFNEGFAGQYNYASYLLDYRKYMKLLSKKNILALQFRANFTSGTNMPFYKLPKLGGDDRLRGLSHKNLYIDRQSYFLQAEVRQELFWRFGGVVFAGMGDVASGLGDFSWNNNRFIYGLGGRFQALKDEKMNIRLDIGFTDNGQSAFYLSVREAF
ncbi:BamA/TamA family outer membrane protein [Reichenbachiella sp. MALMAid0571]|uniref:BamA/TamA family outer membrane protein n=1 Tax=Reichenbachiella sp. MALMAid0571 TaxID=3143939 RepID=UPI0032DEA061